MYLFLQLILKPVSIEEAFYQTAAEDAFNPDERDARNEEVNQYYPGFFDCVAEIREDLDQKPVSVRGLDKAIEGMFACSRDARKDLRRLSIRKETRIAEARVELLNLDHSVSTPRDSILWKDNGCLMYRGVTDQCWSGQMVLRYLNENSLVVSVNEDDLIKSKQAMWDLWDSEPYKHYRTAQRALGLTRAVIKTYESVKLTIKLSR